MIHLDIPKKINIVGLEQIKASMQKAGEITLKLAKAPNRSDLTIQITTDQAIQRLNRQFRDVDTPTDVLAFPADESDPETGKRYLGDVVIAYPTALNQAQNSAHSLEAELVLLSVHGILHLLGYDHGDNQQRSIMWFMQSKVFDELGMEIKTP